MSEQAGSAPDGPSAPRSGSRRGWAVVVVAVLFVLAGVLLGRVVLRDEGPGRSTDLPTPGASAGGSATTSATALDCPGRHVSASVVPAEPSGVDGAASLVPALAPDTAVVCRYDLATSADFAPPTAGQPPPSPRTPPYPLTGSRVLTTGLERLAAHLSVAERGDATGRPCTLMAGPRTIHLLGLTYGSGRLWVAAEQEVNRCTGATNGVFSTPAYLGDVIAQAYGAGAWSG